MVWWLLESLKQQEAQRATYRAPEYNVPPFWGIGQGGHFCLLIGPKNTNSEESCFLSSFVEFLSAVLEKLKMSKPIRGQGGHLVFLIGPKNTNLVEDVEILLPVKFCWIPFSGFRGKIDYVSANQRTGRPSFFTDRPEKHKLGRGGWDLASYEVLLNSIQRFQRRSRKCLSQS